MTRPVTLHFLVPPGFAERPTGGNVYDRRVEAGLVGRGWPVATHEVERDGLLPTLPAHDLVLADSLVVSWHAEALLGSDASVVPLVHTVFGAPGEGELLASAPAVVTTSGWTRRWLVEHHGLHADRLHVAVPGVDVADPVPGSESGGELLCVGSVEPAKGQDVLLAALTELRGLEWRCTLVGVLDRSADFVDELHKTAAEAGITDRVVFAGELAHDAVRAVYATSDALVVPSRAETYGMVVTEALAHGLPVIASAVGGVPEALGRAEDGSHPGMLVRPDDRDALAGALRRWLQDPQRRSRLRRSAARRRLALPTWTATTAQVAAALETVR